jgi:hypothetical protein
MDISPRFKRKLVKRLLLGNTSEIRKHADLTISFFLYNI